MDLWNPILVILVCILATVTSLETVIEFIAKIKEQEDASLALSDAPYNTDQYETFDYIVVGGGSAGSVVVNRLSEDPNVRVLLLEAGGDPTLLANVPGFAEDVKHQPSTDYNYEIEKQKYACRGNNGKSCILTRGKGLGGSSNVYHMTVVRGNPNDYNHWANLTGDPNWSWENVLKIFKIQEDYNGFYQPPDGNHGSDGESYVSAQQSEALFPQLFVKAAKELELNFIDPNSNQSTGYGRLDINVKNGMRWGSYQAFIKPILKRQNLFIYRYAKAIKVKFTSEMRAKSVKYIRHGEVHYAKATREIILCAGSIDSPKLLMLSGIGPAKDLEFIGITPLLDLPVGQNLQDHVGVEIEIYVNESRIAFIPSRDMTADVIATYLTTGKGPLASPFFNPRAVAYYSSSEFNSPNWPDIEILPRGDYLGATLANGTYVNKISFQAFQFRPLSIGEVKLRSSNYEDPPLIDPKYFSNPSDLTRLVESVNFGLRLFLDTKIFQGIDATLPPIPACDKYQVRSTKYWECHIQQMSITLCHPVGTVKMGSNNDPTAVLDSRLRVRGTRGLRVVDSSIMPTVPAGHTHTPTIMIGQQGANFILEDM